MSDPVPCTTGVPQGSVMGSPLWSAVAGSLSVDTYDNCILVKFADDFTFLFPLYKNSTNEHVLRCHKKFLQWVNDNKLRLNLSKCKTMNFIPYNSQGAAGGTTLPGVQLVNELKILGVFIDDTLSWKTHIEYIVKNSSRRLYAVRKLQSLLTTADLKNVYYATVGSLLEYCSPLFLHLPEYQVGQ